MSTPGDYVDFRNDGTVNSLESGYFATLSYGIISDTKMWMKTPDEIYDIQVLTNSELKLYQKDISALPDYIEYTAIFSK